MAEGDVKIHKFNETIKLSIKQSAKGLWYFTEATVSFNHMDEDMKEIFWTHVDEYRKEGEKHGNIFAKGAPPPEIKYENKDEQVL